MKNLIFVLLLIPATVQALSYEGLPYHDGLYCWPISQQNPDEDLRPHWLTISYMRDGSVVVRNPNYEFHSTKSVTYSDLVYRTAGTTSLDYQDTKLAEVFHLELEATSTSPFAKYIYDFVLFKATGKGVFKRTWGLKDGSMLAEEDWHTRDLECDQVK